MRYLPLLFLLLFASCIAPKVIEAPAPPPEATAAEKLEEEEKSAKKSPVKDYAEVITEDAVSDEGLFTVHRIDDKYFYEVPFALLGRDMLLVSRIAKIPAELGGGYLNAGSKTNEQLVQWTRINNKLQLRSVSYSSVADAALPISESVRNNNYAPVIMSFKIAAFSPDSTAAVISVDDLFMDDVQAISGLSRGLRKAYEVRSLDKDRSFYQSHGQLPGER